MRSNLLKNLKKPFRGIVKWLGRTDPELLVRIRYFARFYKPLNLDNPQTLNEKILYLALRSDTSQWTELADKYQVREYVKSKGMESILIPLLGVWDNATEIDFTLLQGEYILKSTNGCGDFVIVDSHKKLDECKIRNIVNKMLHTNYGEMEGGIHYMRIPHRVVAEKLLVNDSISKKYSTSLIDYKFFCFNGKPEFILTCMNRDKFGTDLMTYDLGWNAHPEYLRFSSHYRQSNVIPRPQNLERMIEVAEQLSKGFPVVRIDLYNIAGDIYFGEITFTSLGGMMNYFTDKFLLESGRKISL